MSTEHDPLSDEAFEEAFPNKFAARSWAKRGWQECARRAEEIIDEKQKTNLELAHKYNEVIDENKRLRELLKRGSIHWHPKSKFGKEVSAALEGKE